MTDRLPVMCGFQAAGAAPLVLGHRVDAPETIATAIRIGNPARGDEALAAARDSGGFIDSVTDDEILAAYKLVAATEGVFCEPASAASIAGLQEGPRAGPHTGRRPGRLRAHRPRAQRPRHGGAHRRRAGLHRTMPWPRSSASSRAQRRSGVTCAPAGYPRLSKGPADRPREPQPAGGPRSRERNVLRPWKLASRRRAAPPPPGSGAAPARPGRRRPRSSSATSASRRSAEETRGHRRRRALRDERDAPPPARHQRGRALPLHRRRGPHPGRRQLAARPLLSRHALSLAARDDRRRPPAGAALVDRRARLPLVGRVHQPRVKGAGGETHPPDLRARAPHAPRSPTASTSCCASRTTTRRRSRSSSSSPSTPTFATCSRCAACAATSAARAWRPRPTATRSRSPTTASTRCCARRSCASSRRRRVSRAARRASA